MIQPALWPTVKLGRLCALIGGGTPSRERAEFFSGSIPWLTGQDIPEDFVASVSSGRETITEQAIQNSATNRVPAGTVLLTTRVTVGKTAVADRELCFSQDVTGIVPPKACLDAFFLAWLLASRKQRLLTLNQGSTISGITRKALSEQLIPVPPLSEQQRIVAMLQEAESVRRLRAQADQLTNEIIPALFVSMFGDPERNPHHWPVRKLGTLLRGTPQNGLYKPAEAYGEGTPIIRIGDFYDGRFVDAARLQRLRVSDAERANYGVNNGEVLVNRVNSMEHLGKSVLVAGLTEPTVFESNMMRLVPDLAEMIPEYLIEFLQTPAALLRLRRRAKEAVNQASVNQGDLLSLQVPLPPVALQENFRTAWEALRTARSANGDADGKATELFSSLLAHAFSGELTAKWRERNAAPLVHEAAERDAALAALAPTRTRRAILPAPSAADELPTASALPHLTERQRELWAVVKQHVAEGNRLFTSTSLLESASPESVFTSDEIRRHLDVFAAVGLVIPHSRMDEAEAVPEFFLTWRLPEFSPEAGAESDFLRQSELKRLAEKMMKEFKS